MTKLSDPEKCPKCSSKGEVIDSRKRQGYRRRVHRCDNPNCRTRWWSFQTTVDPRNLRDAAGRRLVTSDLVACER
jgi:hypothetical protein